MDITIKILPTDERTNPTAKLADVELLFGADCGLLAGLRLVGFAVWPRRDGGRTVTFPARQFTVNGERHAYALLRPSTTNDTHELGAMRDAIVAAYTEYEANHATWTAA